MKLLPLGLVLMALIVGATACSEVGKVKLATITTEELSTGIADKSLFVVDNNTPEIFAKNHIVTAQHMDPRQLDQQRLPANKDAKLVFYCKNTWCMASHAGARQALELGYKNSRVYPDGIDGWIKAGKQIESGH